MKDKTPKTNAMRILEKNGIDYKITTYEYDEDHLDAVHIAKSAGLNLEQVFKTIVMINQSKELFVFCLPAQLEISLKKARDLTGSKSIDLLKLDQLQKYTGYIRGGCSPLGMIHTYTTFLEELATLEDTIYVSGGQRGIQIQLKPDDLVKCTNATVASFT
jgi:Cys-tRNA(Pro)/Cys-tRNA(Cys) deacylase